MGMVIYERNLSLLDLTLAMETLFIVFAALSSPPYFIFILETVP